MVPTRWRDWSTAADGAYLELASRCESVVVVGLSMGGSLAVWLAEHHPEIAAVVVVNPLIVAPDADTLAFIAAMIEGGDELATGIGSDIALQGSVELAYPELPLRAAQSLFGGVAEVEAALDLVTCPVLLFSSINDHVVAPVSGERLAERASGPVERIILERSFHVATLDFDRDEIEARTVEFVTAVLGASAQ